MSIATRTGDSGTTGLMYNKRVSKTHPRVEACGAVDELNAALGLVRALSESNFVVETISPLQKTLVGLMGELATELPDLERYQKDGFDQISPEATAKLDEVVKQLESEGMTFEGWVMPGATRQAAALDLARTACRRAERRICVLKEGGELGNEEILIFLNRLSDVLWLMARWAEEKA